MTKYDDLAKLTLDELIERFVTHAIEDDETAVRPGKHGDLVAGNASVGRLVAVYGELRRRGRDAQRKILELLSHSHPGVRRAAVNFAAEFAPEIALPLLEAKAAEGGWDGWRAESSLKACKTGNRRPYPDRPYRSRPSIAEADRWPPVPLDIVDILAMTHNRLHDETPALAEAFRQASLEKRRRLAARAIEDAICELGLDCDDVEEAQYALRFERLPAPEEHEKMKVLASRLEEKARRERETDPNDEYDKAGSLVRTAHAVRALTIALTGDVARLDEVIHEVIASQEQMDAFVPYLLELFQ